ncbi:HAD family hydrolase [Candidatus Micrarchaeota archaeon]|nr:HAD family hydrolase [Candidatus Micrarchaeota archaeon]
MIKLVLFDIDGTLVDTDTALVRAFQNTFSNFKMRPPTEKEVLRGVGNEEENWIKLIWTGERPIPKQKIDEMAEYFRCKYFGFYFPVMAHLMSGAKETLEGLRAKGIKTAIITNGKHEYVERVTSYFKITELIDYAVSVEDVKHIKPSPEPIKHALEHFKAKPDEAVYVGDTEIDAKAAHAAGVHFALVVQSRNALVKAGHRLGSLKELLSVVQET